MCIIFFKNSYSPLVLCMLLVATHEKSRYKEFQGGACSATLAGFGFTWTRDIGVEQSRSPSTPYFSGLFHGNHTVAAGQKTHHKTEDHICVQTRTNSSSIPREGIGPEDTRVSMSMESKKQ